MWGFIFQLKQSFDFPSFPFDYKIAVVTGEQIQLLFILITTNDFTLDTIFGKCRQST